MEVRNVNIEFNAHQGSGPRVRTEEVIFDAPVTKAVALLTGFDVAFSRDNDRELGELIVRLEAEIDELAPRRVNVSAIFGLRDWSEDFPFDDNYEGIIKATVIAE
jgi:hypothetical protein